MLAINLKRILLGGVVLIGLLFFGPDYERWISDEDENSSSSYSQIDEPSLQEKRDFLIEKFNFSEEEKSQFLEIAKNNLANFSDINFSEFLENPAAWVEGAGKLSINYSYALLFSQEELSDKKQYDFVYGIIMHVYQYCHYGRRPEKEVCLELENLLLSAARLIEMGLFLSPDEKKWLKGTLCAVLIELEEQNCCPEMVKNVQERSGIDCYHSRLGQRFLDEDVHPF